MPTDCTVCRCFPLPSTTDDKRDPISRAAVNFRSDDLSTEPVGTPMVLGSQGREAGPGRRESDGCWEHVTEGVRDLACRWKNDVRSFRRAAEDPSRAAQNNRSAEPLRQRLERDGQQVLPAQEQRLIAPVRLAADGIVPGDRTMNRLDVGVDGGRVPMITVESRRNWRNTVVQNRR